MNPEKTKILFTDLDETLLSSDKTISKENLEAIRKMTEAGHKFVISTGRPLQSALLLAREYNFIAPGFYVSSFNGGLIYDCYEQKTLSTASIPLPLVRTIFDEAKKRSIHVHTYSKEAVIAERDSEMLRHYVRVIKLPSLIVDSVTDYLDYEPLKVIVADLHDHEMLEDFRQTMKPVLEPALNSVFSNPSLLEYGNPAATKGNAVKSICEYFNIPIENSIAAGDEENDITMIDVAGVGVAMCNGKENVKRHGDYITEHDNNHHGIKEIIEKFIL